ncbi:Nucleoside diphosphate-linked moiety X motif 8 [Hondaea fermentalgiana]|uniref:Nucleoside diphosphate-linked moiety X motif 8 n=1 Tax=Hondaea fermentalgiana TaxID=2315210 RepID=A0A2R5H2K7_9STRA|nr:Nucleoside diphosphate-linked moiety X motif 8 [Hondaea fermentalgiana]|eukprot:GBG35071.1 Nucleoside diphosphate-linked moiety X motif 8 [Hondaea fermentalgiana]
MRCHDARVATGGLLEQSASAWGARRSMGTKSRPARTEPPLPAESLHMASTLDNDDEETAEELTDHNRILTKSPKKQTSSEEAAAKVAASAATLTVSPADVIHHDDDDDGGSDEEVDEALANAKEKTEDVKESFEDVMVERLIAWLDKKEDSGFRGSFVSGRKSDDLDALVNHYTAPALARALRDREEVLAECASVVCSGTGQLEPEALKLARDLLSPYAVLQAPSAGRPMYRETSMDQWDVEDPTPEEISALRDARKYVLPDFREGGLFHPDVLNRLRKRLNRLPREISSRARKRASVIIPLCHVRNVPSVLFTQRSHKINRHKGEVCFPGGMIDDSDRSVVDAGLRELHEEVGIPPGVVNVLGILRSDWSELAAITGVAVTPVVGYLGAFEELKLDPNPDEVRDSFTVPVSALLDQDNWVVRDYSPPVFREKNAPKDRVIWGLTGYILHRFMRLLPSVVFDKHVVTREFSLGDGMH